MARRRDHSRPATSTNSNDALTHLFTDRKAMLDVCESSSTFFAKTHPVFSPVNGVPFSRIALRNFLTPISDQDFVSLKAASKEGFTPPEDVRVAAQRGLDMRSKYKRGGTMVGVARARDLSNGSAVSASTIMRMVSYFARHEVDKKGTGWSPGSEGYPSAGRIAWLLWGGDPGKRWANAMARRIRSRTT